ncbi:helix-turn-helix domain-containing protein [Paenibacillus lautus]|uniref:helix-turn-helix domain-containing protein n=1 Tax=Paenibacillus lautus TaxID=1401 RepID=UPI003D2ACF44
MNSREQLLSRITSEIELYIDEEVERRTSAFLMSKCDVIPSILPDGLDTLPNGLDMLTDILTAEHISKYLGVSRATIYELFKVNVEYGGIPNFKIGNSRRVDKKDLIRWIEDRKREHKDQFKV